MGGVFNVEWHNFSPQSVGEELMYLQLFHLPVFRQRVFITAESNKRLFI